MKPREFFPNMPDELFNKWLLPFIEAQGWPFNSISDDLQASDWKNNLGINHTLKQWSECEWELISIPLILTNFKLHTLQTIFDIITFSVKGIPTSTANLERTQERFWACASFYREHNTVPWPIVIYEFDEFIRVVDGFHRLAAIFHIGFSPEFKIPAWLAKL